MGKTMDNRPIGIFDSGLGGLTTVRRLREILPRENIAYLGDTARVPYGSRSPETIKKYAVEDAEFLLSLGVKAIAIACNTVSSTALDDVRRIAEKSPYGSVPVFDVVAPPSIAAVKATKTKHIAVIGTAATIRSGAYEREIRACDSGIKSITAIACPLFVPLVENGIISPEDPIALETAKRYLSHLPPDTDTIILGCTHYPLLAPVIQSVAGESVTLIDSGAELAKIVADTLAKNDALSANESKPECKYYVTDSPADFVPLAKAFLDNGKLDIKQVSVGA